jgi:hypothetical protein
MSGIVQRIAGQARHFEWSSAATYSIGMLVRKNGLVYSSLTNSNLNNAPTGTATDNANWLWLSEAHTGPCGGGTS